MAGARRVLLASVGPSGLVCQDVALRLTMSGRPAEAPADMVTQRVTARLLGAGDVCVAVSVSGANVETVAIARSAREAGARVVGVTSFARSPLYEAADLPLVVGAVPTFPLDRDDSRVPHLLLLNALAVCAAERLGRRSAGARAAAEGLLGSLVDDPTRRG